MSTPSIVPITDAARGMELSVDNGVVTVSKVGGREYTVKGLNNPTQEKVEAMKEKIFAMAELFDLDKNISAISHVGEQTVISYKNGEKKNIDEVKSDFLTRNSSTETKGNFESQLTAVGKYMTAQNHKIPSIDPGKIPVFNPNNSDLTLNPSQTWKGITPSIRRNTEGMQPLSKPQQSRRYTEGAKGAKPLPKPPSLPSTQSGWGVTKPKPSSLTADKNIELSQSRKNSEETSKSSKNIQKKEELKQGKKTDGLKNPKVDESKAVLNDELDELLEKLEEDADSSNLPEKNTENSELTDLFNELQEDLNARLPQKNSKSTQQDPIETHAITMPKLSSLPPKIAVASPIETEEVAKANFAKAKFLMNELSTTEETFHNNMIESEKFWKSYTAIFPNDKNASEILDNITQLKNCSKGVVKTFKNICEDFCKDIQEDAISQKEVTNRLKAFYKGPDFKQYTLSCASIAVLYEEMMAKDELAPKEVLLKFLNKGGVDTKDVVLTEL